MIYMVYMLCTHDTWYTCYVHDVHMIHGIIMLHTHDTCGNVHDVWVHDVWVHTCFFSSMLNIVEKLSYMAGICVKMSFKHEDTYIKMSLVT